MQTEQGGNPQPWDRNPALEKGPMPPGAPGPCRSAGVCSARGTARRHRRNVTSRRSLTGMTPCSARYRASGISDLLAPRDQPWLLLAGCRWPGRSLLRGYVVPWPLGAPIWRQPALVLSCSAIPCLFSLETCSTMGKSNTWMHGESDGPGGAVPLPAACLP